MIIVHAQKLLDEPTGFHDDVNHRGETSQGELVDGQARLVSGRGELLDSQSVKLYRVRPSAATHRVSRVSTSSQLLSAHCIKQTHTIDTIPMIYTIQCQNALARLTNVALGLCELHAASKKLG